MKYLAKVIFFLFATSSFGQLEVAKIFSDNMVLQRDVTIPIWGWANDGKKITIHFNGQTYQSRTKKGAWEIKLPPTTTGKEYALTISSADTTISFNNVTFGDVWFCGGQSNMEWYVEASANGEEEVQNANYPNIRLFDVPRNFSQKPVHDISGGRWQACSPQSAKQFSAVGYYFGRSLYQELKIPIGLIGDNYGGTVIESWMSPDAFKDMPVYEQQIALLSQEKERPDKKEIESKFKKWLGKFSSKDKGKKRKDYIWKNFDFTKEPTMQLPTQWESSGIEALNEMDGVVWFEKTILLTSKQAKQVATISLGPIDDSDIIWINGKKIGETQNQWNKDRNYKIADSILKEGKNKIVIRIEDYVGGGGIYGKATQMQLLTTSKKSIVSLAGDWHYKLGYVVTEPMPSNGDFGPNSAPTLLYNGMIAPITKFPIKGVIWYQGESNSYRAVEYKSLKTKWIDNWRTRWNNPELPMIWVQLANYQAPQKEPKESSWAELREAQYEALSKPNTAMITAIDLGDAKTIHPLNKQDVGDRLAKAALEEVYDRKTNYKSPRFLKIKKKRRRHIDIQIKDIGDKLLSNNETNFVNGFSIAGNDQVFHWAKAKIIKPNIIRIYKPKNLKFKSIRYAWAKNPAAINITNSFGYPLLPFRTDNWKLSTDSITRQ